MSEVELRSEVLGLLQNFRGVEPMKELFWSRLNYERVNKPTTRRGWPGSAAEVLVDDPTLLAAGGQGGDFRVLYSRLAKDRLSLADERIVTSRLLKDHPYGLFVFSDRTQTNWHFLNVKMAEEEEKRKLFRRITVGPNEKMRTACQVISQLDLSTISPNLFGLSPLVIQERHDQAFDVEPVTEEFFRQYHATFTKVEDLIRGIRDKDRKRLYTQRLFNRLMFIAFIQKKGWLQFGGKKNPDYLAALWADYKKNGDKNMGFYHERLYNLFFHGLGAQDDVGIININRGGFFKDVIGTVPYLNGGLFEEDEDDKDGSIKVPDEAIRAVLQDLFDHFNFTVTEATPLDVEVAVDPEMLGKVFEELVTGRHETGSYYTPKPIVSFMCREALKGYLEANLTKEKSEAIASFVDEHEPSSLRDAESALEALRRVRCCDPACGSGAYLLGMLHELMDLRSCLFKTKQVDSISSYDRKLEIIQRNLYGVDLDPFAVNIARLRLWLSLAVEFEGEKPEPLPNLKFEIEEGDSLLAPGPEPSQGLMREEVVKAFSQTKALYIKAHGESKRKLEKQVFELKHSIATWTHGKDAIPGFDWPVEFAEVFQEGGFDVVIANPPYVRQELIKSLKPTLKQVFPEVYVGTADLYVYFYARAVQVLRPGGMLVFISSNKWFRSGYGERLRALLADGSCVWSITDFGDLPVFKSATAYPRLHAKAYIFTYGASYDLFGNEQTKHEQGIAVVGSSNLTLSGITHNTELNVVVHGNSNHWELVRWFDELWAEAENFDETLMQEIQQSWAMAPVRPYDVYLKTLYTLVRDRIEGDDSSDILWDDEIANRLATFQRVAVKQAIQMIRVNGGAFVADVVGLGKSYIGAAIIKHFERTDHARPLILCPAPLEEMWDRYNEVYQLNARVLSTGYLVESNGGNILLDNVKFKDRDFLLIDESHNFRHPDTQRYKIVEAFLASGRPVCFLTATPRNKSAWDVFHQIKLFHQQDKTDLPIDPPNLREYFKLIDKGQRKLRDVLSNILIRRTRHHILRWYGFDSETQQPVDPSKFNDYLDGKKKAYVIVAGRPRSSGDLHRRRIQSIGWTNRASLN